MIQDEFEKAYGPFTYPSVQDADIGATDELVQLLARTYCPAQESLAFSGTAWRPTPIARSDAEIYDIEYPRWAKRAHIAVRSRTRQHYVGFVNLRARDLLLKQATGRPLEAIGTSPGSLVCSAYLKPPPHLSESEYRFPVSLELGRYCNELSGWDGTVFSSPLERFGAGMCSQACVYMAAYPMVRFGGQVLGIADLTLLASPTASRPGHQSVRITGLDNEQLCDIFRSESIKLNSLWDIVPFADGPDEEHDPYRVRDAASVMAAYLSQRLPVILLVKAKHLVAANGKFYGDEVISYFKKWDSRRDSSHAILLVGFKAKPLTFVYHDPLGGPYLEASPETLAKATAGTGCEFQMIVPAPPRLRVSLGSNGDSRDITQGHCGPFFASWDWREMIAAHRRAMAHCTGAIATSTEPASLSNYFPLRFPASARSEFHIRSRDTFFHRYLSLNVPASSRKAWDRVRRWLPERLWVEEFKSDWLPEHPELSDRAIAGLWGWAADVPCRRDGLQVPVVQCCDGVLSIDCPRGKGALRKTFVLRNGQTQMAVRKSSVLHVGAITSFCVGTMLDALHVLAKHGIWHVDLFGFQINDLRRYSQKPVQSPLAFLASCGQRVLKTIVDGLATDIRAVQREYGGVFAVEGFATYFPEISSIRRHRGGRQQAVLALSNIVRMCSMLRDGYGIAPQFVEMVAGTRLSNLRSVRGGEQVLATRDGREEKFVALSRSLDELSQVAEKSDVYLSVEVEPGVLPFLRTAGDIKDLVDILDTRSGIAGLRPIACPRRIGLNVDISHMWLCGIEVRDLDVRRIRNRIAHAHIGDIGPGHLCDLVTATVHTPEEYGPWIQFLGRIGNELPRDLGKYPKFSGCVSIELEAARCSGMVATSFHRARSLLYRYVLPENSDL